MAMNESLRTEMPFVTQIECYYLVWYRVFPSNCHSDRKRCGTVWTANYRKKYIYIYSHLEYTDEASVNSLYIISLM